MQCATHAMKEEACFAHCGWSRLIRFEKSYFNVHLQSRLSDMFLYSELFILYPTQVYSFCAVLVTIILTFY